MAREVVLGIEAQERLISGMSKVADLVAPTLGPKGRNVVLDKSHAGGTCIISNDGASIVGDIKLEDYIENQGAQLLIEVATLTNTDVGDGTSIAMLLAKKMLDEGIKTLAAGANPIVLRKGMKKACDKTISLLKEYSTKVETSEAIRRVASISANDEEVGEIIAKITDEISSEGYITIEDSKTMDTNWKIVKGIRLTSGYLSRYMCNDKVNKRVDYENPYILVTDQNISDITTLVPALEAVKKASGSLIVIAKDVTGSAVSGLILNQVKGIIKVAGVKMPGVGNFQNDMFEDLAIFTGATFIKEELGLQVKDVTIEMLGRADKIQIDEKNTIVLGGWGNEESKNNRVAEINKQIELSKSDYDKERYKERISKLTNGFGIIQIGAMSEVEQIEKKIKVEDAILATKAAGEEGIIPGGGVTFVKIAKDLEELIESLDGEEKIGAEIVKRAITEPAKQIAFNSGIDGKVYLDRLQQLPFGFGIDMQDEKEKDLLEAGVIDPAKVWRVAFENASSVARTVITTEALNVIIPKSEPLLDAIQ